MWCMEDIGNIRMVHDNLGILPRDCKYIGMEMLHKRHMVGRSKG